MMKKLRNILIFSAISLFLEISLLASPIKVKNSQEVQEIDNELLLLKGISKSFSKVAKNAIPAVVYIESFPKGRYSEDPQNMQKNNKRGPYENPFEYFSDEFFNRFFGFPNSPERVPQREIVRGTGFIVSPDGFILTNNHVVADSGKLQVSLSNGKKLSAEIVGLDPKTDLAVIKINEKNLPFLSFGNSDQIEVGEWAIAIGNPFGLQATVTVGIVSAKGRNQLHIADFEDFIQTDAAINPGNSGGPLLDIDGKVIGVNTAIVSGSGGYMGIGFAIPSSMAQRIMNQLIKDGQVQRGFLGVTLQQIDSELAKFYHLDSTKGVLVTEVVKGSPADIAGLQQEDIIIACNGKEIESLVSFRNSISLMPPNSKIILKIIRNNKELEIPVIISLAPRDEYQVSLDKLGIQAQNLTPEQSSQFGFSSKKGVLITAVAPDSPADCAGVKPGVLILAINRKKVESLKDLNNILKEMDNKNRILLMLGYPNDVIRFVALELN